MFLKWVLFSLVLSIMQIFSKRLIRVARSDELVCHWYRRIWSYGFNSFYSPCLTNLFLKIQLLTWKLKNKKLPVNSNFFFSSNWSTWNTFSQLVNIKPLDLLKLRSLWLRRLKGRRVLENNVGKKCQLGHELNKYKRKTDWRNRWLEQKIWSLLILFLPLLCKNSLEILEVFLIKAKL